MSDFEAEGVAMHTPEYERDIAETMAERDEDLFSYAEAHGRAARRERIAAQIYAAMVTGSFVAYAVSNGSMSLRTDPEEALLRADDLVEALDAAVARDREATQ